MANSQYRQVSLVQYLLIMSKKKAFKIATQAPAKNFTLSLRGIGNNNQILL